MTYATLMVHLELGRSNAGLLKIVRDIAEHFHAGVIGIAACQPMQIVYTAGEGYVSSDLIEQDRKDIDREIKEAESEFRSALQTHVGSLEWRSSVMFAPLADYLAQEARSADLVITGVASVGLLDASRRVNTGDLVMQVGRPVLIVPAAADKLKLERVVIAWKDTRESRRAIFDALPLLQKSASCSRRRDRCRRGTGRGPRASRRCSRLAQAARCRGEVSRVAFDRRRRNPTERHCSGTGRRLHRRGGLRTQPPARMGTWRRDPRSSAACGPLLARVPLTICLPQRKSPIRRMRQRGKDFSHGTRRSRLRSVRRARTEVLGHLHIEV